MTGSYPVVFVGGIITGARLMGVQLMMSHDEGGGINPSEFAQQGKDGTLLLQCACVLRDAAGRESALIADTDAVAVMVFTMGAHGIQRPSAVNFTVTGDIEVIPDVRETAVADVIVTAVVHGEALPLPRSTAVNDYQCNSSHIFFI